MKYFAKGPFFTRFAGATTRSFPETPFEQKLSNVRFGASCNCEAATLIIRIGLPIESRIGSIYTLEIDPFSDANRLGSSQRLRSPYQWLRSPYQWLRNGYATPKALSERLRSPHQWLRSHISGYATATQPWKPSPSGYADTTAAVNPDLCTFLHYLLPVTVLDKTCPACSGESALDAGGAARHSLAAGHAAPVHRLDDRPALHPAAHEVRSRCPHTRTHSRDSEVLGAGGRVLGSLRMLAAVTFFVLWEALSA